MEQFFSEELKIICQTNRDLYPSAVPAVRCLVLSRCVHQTRCNQPADNNVGRCAALQLGDPSLLCQRGAARVFGIRASGGAHHREPVTGNPRT